MQKNIENFFHFSTYKANFKTEVIAGFTSFLAVSYIIIVNPSILAQAGLPFSGVLTATVLVMALGSLLMGLVANNPIVLAPGMGINAFFTYTVILGMKVPWQTALGLVFWSGIIFILFSVTPVRKIIIRSIPYPLRSAAAAGIGLFISLIGLRNGGFIVGNSATLIARGTLNSSLFLFLGGLLLTCFFTLRKTKGGFLLSIGLTTLAAFSLGRLWGDVAPIVNWKGLVAMPDFSLFLQCDFVGSLNYSMLPVLFSFLFVDMFDSLSSFIGIAESGNLLEKNGEPRHLKESLLVDGIVTSLSGLLGTSSGTSFIESAAGVRVGGRTGLTAIVAGLLALPFLFFSPLLSIVPSLATAPILVIVGLFMTQSLVRIKWSLMDEAIPCFVTMILIPFTYSITEGMIWGLLCWTLVKLFVGKRRELSWGLIILNISSIFYLTSTAL